MKAGEKNMMLSFNHKKIDFEFPIERIDIEFPSISIVFENVQDLHHFERILKEHNGKTDGITCGYDVEYSIQSPLEFLDGIEVNIEDM